MTNFVERRLKQRQEKLTAEFQQLLNDAAHWNRTHPNDPPIVIEPITEVEIQSGVPRQDGVH